MTITKKLSTLLIAAFCVMPHTLAQNAGKGGESATVRIEVERLPDLKPLVQAINFLLSTASLPLWVVIAGNWYADDAIELFDTDQQFRPVKKTSQMRSRPYILPTSGDDVLIFGSRDTRNNEIDTIVADRLHGSELRLPLFDKWRPMHSLGAGRPQHICQCFDHHRRNLRAEGDKDSTWRVLSQQSHPTRHLPDGRDRDSRRGLP